MVFIVRRFCHFRLILFLILINSMMSTNSSFKVLFDLLGIATLLAFLIHFVKCWMNLLISSAVSSAFQPHLIYC
uniref:Putative product n=1 Tax=Xenopsylla cheopis TaxID=163159 RepID=A0A6M2DVH9_XENCH